MALLAGHVSEEENEAFGQTSSPAHEMKRGLGIDGGSPRTSDQLNEAALDSQDELQV